MTYQLGDGNADETLNVGGNGQPVQVQPSSTGTLGFFGTTPVVKQAALTAQLTTITHTAPSPPDYAIQNLTASGGYGFVTANEGNSVLAVIANLQERLAQVEARLEAYGLVIAN